MTDEYIEIEVAFAQAEKQWLRAIRVPVGSTIDDVIRMSGIQQDCPDIDLSELETGVWGHPAERSQTVVAQQRVELYRPLLLDPREARRQLALVGRTMNDGESI